jgi:hypothetical protein
MVVAGRVTAGVVALFLTASGTTARPEEGRVYVRIGGVRDREAVERAAGRVRQRLRDPECRRVLSDFGTDQGRTLAQILEALGPSPDEYLEWVYFYDGFGVGRCMQKSVLATTEPGSRVVRICGPRFTELETREPLTAQAVVLHEVLHTLGLRENPPHSAHITQRVVERCYPELLRGPFAKSRAHSTATPLD